jgi:hypothetical protein
MIVRVEGTGDLEQLLDEWFGICVQSAQVLLRRVENLKRVRNARWDTFTREPEMLIHRKTNKNN